MGYSTDFSGSFTLNKPLAENHRKYLMAFSGTRRMRRNPNKITTPDPIREAVGLPLGHSGDYFVGADLNNAGQGMSADIIDYNCPPSDQPGLWCQWVPNNDGTEIEWDGGEKFYNYIEWIKYLISNFLKPWGYKLNGTVEWHGEEHGDMGRIIIKDNKVTIKNPKISWE